MHLLRSKKNVIVPINWIKGAEDQWDKFVNYGVNSNQKFICFFTMAHDSMDENGKPYIDYPPNFQASMQIDFPEEGCYFAKILKFKCKYK